MADSRNDDSINFIAHKFEIILKTFRKCIVEYFSRIASCEYHRARSFFDDIFIHWYFESVRKGFVEDYIPNKMAVSESDIQYFIDNYNNKIPF